MASNRVRLYPQTTETILAMGVKQLLSLKRTTTDELVMQSGEEEGRVEGGVKKARVQLLLEYGQISQLTGSIGLDAMKAKEEGQIKPPKGP